MKKVTIYSTRICPYCVRAKNFFDKKEIPYEDIMVDQDPEQLQTMMEKSQRQSVPQIFIGDYHVGGFDDLIEHDMDAVFALADQIRVLVYFYPFTTLFSISFFGLSLIMLDLLPTSIRKSQKISYSSCDILALV